MHESKCTVDWAVLATLQHTIVLANIMTLGVHGIIAFQFVPLNIWNYDHWGYIFLFHFFFTKLTTEMVISAAHHSVDVVSWRLTFYQFILKLLRLSKNKLSNFIQQMSSCCCDYWLISLFTSVTLHFHSNSNNLLLRFLFCFCFYLLSEAIWWWMYLLPLL